MLNLKTGKQFDGPSAREQMTRRDFGRGLAAIIGAGVAPSVAIGLAGSANASVGGMMRNVGARQAAMFGGKQKPYDREVAYLESVGGSYILSDAKYTPSNKYLFEFGIYSSNQIAQGVRKACGWDAGAYLALFKNGFNNGYTSDIQITGDVTIATNIKIIVNYGTYSQTEYTYGQYGSNQRPHGSLSAYASGFGYPLFAVVSLSLQTKQSEGLRYTFFKSFVNDVLINDYIPVVKDNIGYMYDLNNSTGGASGNGLIGNMGSGYFDFPGRIS